MKRNLGYGSIEARTYERKRRSSPGDIIFWSKEQKELSYAIHASRIHTRASRILEAGCGTGRFVRYLAEKGYRVHGIDISIHMLNEAVKKLRNEKLVSDFVRADISRLPLRNGCFDFVYCIRIMNQLPSEKYALMALGELCRVCKVPGALLVEYVNRISLSCLARSRSTVLTLRDIESVMHHLEGCKIVYVHGVLFFSQTVWNILPLPMLNLVSRLDELVSRHLPQFSTRCYVYISKQ